MKKRYLLAGTMAAAAGVAVARLSKKVPAVGLEIKADKVKTDSSPDTGRPLECLG